MAAAARRAQEQLRDSIEALNDLQHAEIFSILEQHGVPYSDNTDGVVIDFKFIPKEALERIQKYMAFCAEVDQKIAAGGAL